MLVAVTVTIKLCVPAGAMKVPLASIVPLVAVHVTPEFPFFTFAVNETFWPVSTAVVCGLTLTLTPDTVSIVLPLTPNCIAVMVEVAPAGAVAGTSAWPIVVASIVAAAALEEVQVAVLVMLPVVPSEKVAVAVNC